ncbi:MAG: glutamate formimidoyltransferase [Paludibacteraceae bacterium]|nr:glutamate formimidoyltransferase [Paludibacteraceae bacterium]
MRQLIECVPNFSEGRDMGVIKQITDVIEKIEGVKLLDVDPGEATNRTVVTFVGEPEDVLEAAFQAIKKAKELIDMRHHHGAHPRMGATDVCPLVPVANITLEECAELARQLGKRVGDELGVPVYAYESAAFTPERRNLAICRKGEYEALSKRFGVKEEQPDFGPCVWNDETAKSGATAIGARDFLIAVNYNLNSTSTRRANAIAFDVREKGRPKREDMSNVTSKKVLDENGEPIMIPGTLKGTKAIGWFIDEYGIAQVSMNITDIHTTPLHVAFDEVCRAAAARGVRVTGTEIVGLIPKSVLIDAGKYFLRKQQRSVGIHESEIIKIAVKSMGLDELKPFVPEEKVIEYMIEDKSAKKLVDMTCKGFAEETASESPAPGGGSISAYMGSLAAALGTMVANLSSHKPGWDARWEFFSEWADKGQAMMSNLVYLVDEDTNAFNKIMAVFAMPKGTPEEKAARSKAMQEATLYATQVPLQTMKAAFETFGIIRAMAEEGNPNSVSDAGVGALAARAAVLGAGLNVKINAAGLKDRETAESLIAEANKLIENACREEKEILEIVNGKIG